MKWYLFAVLWCHTYGLRQVYLQRTDGKVNSKLHSKERALDIDRVVAALTENTQFWRGEPSKDFLVVRAGMEWMIWRISGETVTDPKEKKTRHVFIYDLTWSVMYWYLYEEKQLIKTFRTGTYVSDIQYRPVSHDLYWMGEETSYSVLNVDKQGALSTYNMQVEGSVRQIRFAGTVTIVMTSIGIFKMEGQSKAEMIIKLPQNSGNKLFVDTSSTPIQIWWAERTTIWAIGRIDINGNLEFKKSIKGIDLISGFTVATYGNEQDIYLCTNQGLVKLRLNPDMAAETVLPTQIRCGHVVVEGNKVSLITTSSSLDTYDLKSGKLVHSLSINCTDKCNMKYTFQFVYQ